MRILLVSASADYSTKDVWKGIRGGLLADGHEVIDYSLVRRLLALGEGLNVIAPAGKIADPGYVAYHASEGLAQKVILSRHRPQWLVFVSGMSLHPDALAAVRALGVKVCGIFTESPYHTADDGELRHVPFCDVVFTNERTSVATFQAVLDRTTRGAAYYLAHAYDPDLHRPASADDPPLLEDERSDVLFIGTGWTERQALLEAVDWAGIKLRLGGLWSGVQDISHLREHVVYPCLQNEQTVRLYRGAKIVINPHRWYEGAESTNPRTREVAACGTFQVADYRQEIRDEFGDAIPLFAPSVPWQLAATIRHFLANDVARARLARAALARVQGQTFRARAQTIIEAMLEAEQRASRKVIALPTAAGAG